MNQQKAPGQTNNQQAGQKERPKAPPKQEKKNWKPCKRTGIAKNLPPARHLQGRKAKKNPGSPARKEGPKTPTQPPESPQESHHHKNLPDQTQDRLHLPLVIRARISRALSHEPLPVEDKILIWCFKDYKHLILVF